MALEHDPVTADRTFRDAVCRRWRPFRDRVGILSQPASGPRCIGQHLQSEPRSVVEPERIRVRGTAGRDRRSVQLQRGHQPGERSWPDRAIWELRSRHSGRARHGQSLDGLGQIVPLHGACRGENRRELHKPAQPYEPRRSQTQPYQLCIWQDHRRTGPADCRADEP